MRYVVHVLTAMTRHQACVIEATTEDAARDEAEQADWRDWADEEDPSTETYIDWIEEA